MNPCPDIIWTEQFFLIPIQSESDDLQARRLEHAPYRTKIRDQN